MPEQPGNIILWKGVPLEDLSHEELLEVARYYAKEWFLNNSRSAIRQRALGGVEMLKRGGVPHA